MTPDSNFDNRVLEIRKKLAVDDSGNVDVIDFAHATRDMLLDGKVLVPVELPETARRGLFMMGHNYPKELWAEFLAAIAFAQTEQGDKT